MKINVQICVRVCVCVCVGMRACVATKVNFAITFEYKNELSIDSKDVKLFFK